ncbi:ABC transporter ATP-binding protein [Leifsonia sp. YAF41]|uniref:ABC transporter ATP-binding protein n=1 Tax=Leifsonia sp. YAF41 TaxID=3233086 RepID=UPI003F967B03
MGTIQIDQLSREFANVAAVDNISLTVDDGDFLVLLGPSGCGKTTLLRMIAGLLEPTSGRILLDGRDITQEPSKKRDLAMVFQSYALYPHLSVARNLGFPLRVAGVDKATIRERVTEVARMLEIDHLLQRKPKELSGGQRQRVAVGRALVRNPRAFLMDEPLSNLDAKLRTATRHELTSLHRSLGATFVYVTHDQVEAMTMATKIAVLNKGRLEQLGTPEEVYDRPASVFVAGFLGSPAMNLQNVDVTSMFGTVNLNAPGIDGQLWDGIVAPFEAVLGIRPEHLAPVAVRSRMTEPGVTITGVVDIVENLGSEEVIYVSVGEHRVATRRPRPSNITAGAEITLFAPADQVHLFDAVSGRRLEWRPESSEAGGSVATPADALAGV